MQVRTISWVWNWGMHERKRGKLRERASDIRNSSGDPDKTRHFASIKKGTEMRCNKSHTRVAESVGCTLDSDSFFHFKPAQPANLCFSLHWLPCSYLCSKKEESPECWMDFQWVCRGTVLHWALRNQSELMKNNNKISVHFPHAHKVNVLCSLLPSLTLETKPKSHGVIRLVSLVQLPCSITEKVWKAYYGILHSPLF